MGPKKPNFAPGAAKSFKSKGTSHIPALHLSRDTSSGSQDVQSQSQSLDYYDEYGDSGALQSGLETEDVQMMDADDASITAEEEGGEEDTGADADNEDEEEDEPDIGEIDAVEEIVDEKESKAAAEYAERYFDNVDDDSQDDAIGIFDTHQPVDLAHDAEQSQEPQSALTSGSATSISDSPATPSSGFILRLRCLDREGHPTLRPKIHPSS